jgi:DNA-binding transcriptional MerR regulator
VKMNFVDAEWVALIEEAKDLGITVEEIREWLTQNSEEEA